MRQRFTLATSRLDLGELKGNIVGSSLVSILLVFPMKASWGHGDAYSSWGKSPAPAP